MKLLWATIEEASTRADALAWLGTYIVSVVVVGFAGGLYRGQARRWAAVAALAIPLAAGLVLSAAFALVRVVHATNCLRYIALVSCITTFVASRMRRVHRQPGVASAKKMVQF
jgi:hypothetical protein